MEVWKAIQGYEGRYEVSNLGRVKSLPKAQFNYERILKPYINPKNGYCYIRLSKDGKSVGKRLHTLVMNAFCPVNKKYGYDPDYTIDHLDGDRTNNRLENLEWVTQAENTRRALAVRKRNWFSHKVINLDTKEVFNSAVDAAKSVGGTRCNAISRVCKGKRSAYRNTHFAYYDDFINNTIPEFKGKFKKRSSASLWR